MNALDDLGVRLPGRVGRPGSAQWEEARRVFYPPARGHRPAAVVTAEGAEDVVELLAWARETGERVSVRSGGHAFDGFSVPEGGVLLDLQRLAEVEVLPGGRVALGPGARVKRVALELADRGLAVPIGNCPAVGLGGLATGGGFGYLSRALGMSCDSVVEAVVVTAKGEVVRCSADREQDLFWALRGGGGAAGIATELVFEPTAVDTVAGFGMTFDPEAATEVILRFAAVLEAGPDELDLKLALRTTGAERFLDTVQDGPPGAIPGRPYIEIEGHLLGEVADAREMLQPLLDPALTRQGWVEEVSYHDAVLREIPVVTPDDPAPATIRPARISSDFGGAPDRAGAEAIAAFLAELQRGEGLSGGGVVIEPADGAVSATTSDRCAFPHRDSRFVYEWELFYAGEPTAAERARQDELIAALRRKLGDTLSGGRYINYTDGTDSPEAIWLANLPRLERTVDAVDPERTIVSRLHPR